jgi:DNA polymerase III subunit gamma/tau
MENFIVSARKYRPQHFNTVVGQSHITTTLKNAILQQHLAHAFLFCGPRGVGKTTCARILAKTINCEHITSEGEACDQCQSCVSFNEGASMNIFELDAASNNSVEDIRNLVEQVRFAPQAGKYKVYIVDEVHMLTAAAFNAFLKTLEEPPPYAIFILATTEKHKILPTILSRCQIFDFKRITANDTIDHLVEICEKENIQAENAALQLIAQKSEGCMRDALSILDKIVSFTNSQLTYHNTLEHLNILDADYYFQLIDSMLKQDLPGALLLYDDINQKGFEGDMVLNGFAECIRNLIVCKDERVLPLLDVMDNFKPRYAALAQKISLPYLISLLNVLNETEMGYRTARNKKLQVELGLIKMCYLQQALEVTHQAGQLQVETKVGNIKPLSFRHLPVTISRNNTTRKEKTSPAKLIIESKPEPKPTPAEKVAPPPVEKKPITTSGVTSKLSGLGNLRKEIALQQQSKIVHDAVVLTDERLPEFWASYIQYLKDTKNPAQTSFQLAILERVDEKSFIIHVANNVQGKYIEGERSTLIEKMYESWHNRTIQFKIMVSPTRFPTVEMPVVQSNKELFLQMSQQFPLLKELQQRLGLDVEN